MHESQGNPIGIFDSGVGGLTVVNAIKQLLPNENIVYFGDTAHLPYGDKSKETIISYSKQITRFLLNQKCKIIVVACNTASANAYDAIIKETGSEDQVIDVINPVTEFIINECDYKNVGIIGTKGTINSDTYSKKLKQGKPGINVSSLATPLFVPMIEEGFIFDNISNSIINSYLSKPELNNIDALILGCTHYPVIKNQISKFYNFELDIIDSSKIVAERLRDVLTKNNLLNNERGPERIFYVSDYTDYFQIISKLFFEKEIQLKKINIF